MTDEPTTKHGRDMTVGSIPRHLIMFSLPMLFGNVIQTLYGLVNAFWVGKCIGKEALAAVTGSFPIVFLLMAVAMGLTIGTGILVAQFAGAKDWDRLKKTIQTSTSLLAFVAVFFCVAGWALAGDIMRWMGTPRDIHDMSAGYLRIYILSMPATFGLFLIASGLRGIGDSKTPLYFQVGALATTAALDPVLMFGWLGFPKLGLNGTAVATAVAQSISVLALIICVARRKSIVSPDWRCLSIHGPTLWQLLVVAVPSMVQQSLVSFGMVFVTSIIMRFGDNALAGFGAGMRVDGIAFMPALTFGGSVAMLVGQNIGAGQVHRAKEVFKWGIIVCGGITLAIAILAVSAPHFLVTIFISEADSHEVVVIGVNYLRIVAISYVFFAVLFVANGVINGAGYTVVTTVISLIALWVARVPLAYYLSHRMNAVEGVFYAMTISNAVSMSIALCCYLSGFWKKPIIRKQAQPEPAQDVEPFPPLE